MLGDRPATARNTVWEGWQIVVLRQRGRLISVHAKQIFERPGYPRRKGLVGQVSRDDKGVRLLRGRGVVDVDKLSLNGVDLELQRADLDLQRADLALQHDHLALQRGNLAWQNCQRRQLSVDCGKRGYESKLTRNQSAGSRRQICACTIDGRTIYW